ncbi:MAG: serpin family protein [bacterium]|nr:serpin family protein [bacterium]
MKKIFYILIFIFLLFSCAKADIGKKIEKKESDFGKGENFYNFFGFDLLNRLFYEDENVVISPFSISTALAITYEGAGGETEKEIKKVFHFPDKESLRKIYSNQIKNFDKESKEITIKISNGLWMEKSYKFRKDYPERIKESYNSFAQKLDFINETEESRLKINKFIEEFTEEKIKDFIPKGMIDESTALVITNAIYFNSLWEKQFEKKYTFEEDFFVNKNKKVKCKMMSTELEKPLKYFENEKFFIVEFPYADSNFSAFFIVPKEEIKTLYPLKYSEIENSIDSMRYEKFDRISFPKFKLEKKYLLNEILIKMGMKESFTQNADFSFITDFSDLYISNVIHQSFLKVDEEGSEAAAATGVVIVKETAVMPKRILKIDKPFLFIIMEKQTGNMLFIAKVENPQFEE